MAGIWNIFGKIADQFQGRIERLKNEKRKLENERKKLIDGAWTEHNGERVVAIDARLREIQGILETKASD